MITTYKKKQEYATLASNNFLVERPARLENVMWRRDTVKPPPPFCFLFPFFLFITTSEHQVFDEQILAAWRSWQCLVQTLTQTRNMNRQAASVTEEMERKKKLIYAQKIKGQMNEVTREERTWQEVLYFWACKEDSRA